MADTGAPWNIPFAEPADLVRDWPALSEDVADAVAAGLTAAGNAGIGSNVQHALLDTTFSASLTEGDETSITGLSVNFTPTTATSKVLVLVHIGTMGNSRPRAAASVRLYRDSTRLAPANLGLRLGVNASNFIPNTDAASRLGVAFMYLDDPQTTSQLTYDVRMVNNDTGTRNVFINRNNSDSDAVFQARTNSTITCIEVAA